jgi:hypothetical protein
MQWNKPATPETQKAPWVEETLGVLCQGLLGIRYVLALLQEPCAGASWAARGQSIAAQSGGAS